MAMRSRFLGPAAVIAGTVLVFVTPAGAQERPAQSQGTVAKPMSEDIVFLRSGGFYRGRVTEIVPGDHVTVAIESGETKQLAWTEIDRIVASTGPTTPASVIPVNPASPAPGASPAAPKPAVPTTPETPARLDTPPPAEGPVQPRTAWRANRPLLVTGAIMFGVGYGPNLAAAVPSTVGLAGRITVFVLTVGLAALACSFGGNSDSYICEGQHGAMQLLVPFAGPFLFADDHPRDTVLNERGRPLGDVAKGLLYTSGGLQIAGLVSILTAIAIGKQEPVPGRKAATALSSPPSPAGSFFVLPQANADTIGVTFGLHRW